MLRNLVRGTANMVKNRPPILSSTRLMAKAAYEGEGKTTVRVLNQETDAGLMIDAYGTYGFKLNNGITVLGPMALFPRSVLSWQVEKSEDVSEGSMRLFTILAPKIDLVIVGLETNSRSSHDHVFRVCRTVGLSAEILPTEHACSTFNFLNAEGRYVVAALIPPLHISSVSEDDMLRSQLYHQNLYNKDLLA